jgi:hypothetical protein
MFRYTATKTRITECWMFGPTIIIKLSTMVQIFSINHGLWYRKGASLPFSVRCCTKTAPMYGTSSCETHILTTLSSGNISVIKSGRTIQEENLGGGSWEKHNKLLEYPKRPLGRFNLKWKDNINLNLKEVRSQDVSCILNTFKFKI